MCHAKFATKFGIIYAEKFKPREREKKKKEKKGDTSEKKMKQQF